MPQINIQSIQIIINPSNQQISVMQYHKCKHDPIIESFFEDKVEEQSLCIPIFQSRIAEYDEVFHHYVPQFQFDDQFQKAQAPIKSNFSASTFSQGNFDNVSILSEVKGQSYQIPYIFDRSQDHIFGEFTENYPKIETSKFFKNENKKEQNQKEEDTQLKNQQNSHDETKNIPKNYIKAIFALILENQKLLQQTVWEGELISIVKNLKQFIITEKKTKKYTIQRLKSLWLDPKFGKVMRMISGNFLRKRCLGYIFGSKIEKKMSHIRHRYKFLQALKDPRAFTNIK